MAVSSVRQASRHCSSAVVLSRGYTSGCTNRPASIFLQLGKKLSTLENAQENGKPHGLQVKDVHLRALSLQKSRLKCSATAQTETAAIKDRVEEGFTEEVGGAQVKHKYMSNNGVRIHYVEAGKPDGQLAVLLHGWPSFWYSWVYQIKPLVDAGYHVLAPDMRGYNLSDKPPNVEAYGREPVTSDIKMLMEANNHGKPAVLIAHDWGGAVAWAFVQKYPHLVSRLITLNIPESSTLAEALKNSWEQKKKSWYMAFFQLPAVPEWLLSRNDFEGLQKAYGGSKPRTKELLDRHVEAYSRPDALTASINYYRAGGKGYWKHSPDFPPARVDIPVKVIWGEDDIALGKELATPPKNLVPSQEVVFLPKVSHWCMWDDPKRVNDEILAFLSKKL